MRVLGSGFETLALGVVTVNPSSFASLKPILQELDSSIHIVCIQEILTDQSRVADLQTWLMRRGWKSLFLPSMVTPKGGIAAGVGICVGAFLGLRELTEAEGGSCVHAHRVLAAQLEIPGAWEFTLYSVYMHDGQGASADNIQVLADIGSHVQTKPLVVLAGDFNMLPGGLSGSGMPAAAGLEVLAPHHSRPTCVTSKAARVIDYFMMSAQLAKAVRQLKVMHQCPLAPHHPMQGVFLPQRCQAQGSGHCRASQVPHHSCFWATQSPGRLGFLSRCSGSR